MTIKSFSTGGDGGVEKAIERYTADLQFEIQSSTGRRLRTAKAMLAILPPFLRVMDAERDLMLKGAEDAGDDLFEVEPAKIDDFMHLFSVLITNMVGQLVFCVVSEHEPGQCKGCDAKRDFMVQKLLVQVHDNVMLQFHAPDLAERKQ